MLIHLAPVLWAVAIFVSSSIPSNRLPPVAVLGFDKLVHFTIYFVLCWLVHRSLRTQTKSSFVSTHSLIVSIIAAILYGITDEIHQSMVPGRDPSVYDVAANALGGLLYAGIFRKFRPGGRQDMHHA
jgi:VanZ family protein